MKFFDRLDLLREQKKTLLCVGIDPDFERIPADVRRHDDFLYSFCKAIIDHTAPYAIAFKFNFAFFEVFGKMGWETLARLRAAVPEDCLTVADAKRGDIGSTAKRYAESIFEHLGFDAVTLNPYLGRDASEPFLSFARKGLFFLCVTSNPGAVEMQTFPSEDNPLYLHVARRVRSWNENGNCGLVVGATHPRQLQRVCEAAPDMPMLIPGIGAQGGSVGDALRVIPHRRLLLAASRSILYAGDGADFAEAAARAAASTSETIRGFLGGETGDS